MSFSTVYASYWLEGLSWSYGSWIYNYLSPLQLWVRTPLNLGVLDTTLCDTVCQWHTTGRWFSPSSSTNKTDCHEITEILLKVALNTITIHTTLLVCVCVTLLVGVLPYWCVCVTLLVGVLPYWCVCVSLFVGVLPYWLVCYLIGWCVLPYWLVCVTLLVGVCYLIGWCVLPYWLVCVTLLVGVCYLIGWCVLSYLCVYHTPIR
jgi:hypothetical protein